MYIAHRTAAEPTKIAPAWKRQKRIVCMGMNEMYDQNHQISHHIIYTMYFSVAYSYYTYRIHPALFKVKLYICYFSFFGWNFGLQFCIIQYHTWSIVEAKKRMKPFPSDQNNEKTTTIFRLQSRKKNLWLCRYRFFFRHNSAALLSWHCIAKQTIVFCRAILFDLFNYSYYLHVV